MSTTLLSHSIIISVNTEHRSALYRCDCRKTSWKTCVLSDRSWNQAAWVFHTKGLSVQYYYMSPWFSSYSFPPRPTRSALSNRVPNTGKWGIFWRAATHRCAAIGWDRRSQPMATPRCVAARATFLPGSLSWCQFRHELGQVICHCGGWLA